MADRSKRYRLYVDESGDHAYSNMDSDGHRYLGVLGCIINDDTYQQSVVPRIDEIKTRHFTAGPAAVFHRKDLLKARGHFSCLQDAAVRAAFDDDLMGAIGSLRYGLICV